MVIIIESWGWRALRVLGVGREVDHVFVEHDGVFLIIGLFAAEGGGDLDSRL